MIDLARLERVLVQAAREGHAVTYGSVLYLFGLKVGSGTVGHLCRLLGTIDRERALRGEPELACLVVKQSDGEPGVGYFAIGDPIGEESRRRLVRERQERAYAWARTLPPMASREDTA